MKTRTTRKEATEPKRKCPRKITIDAFEPNVSDNYYDDDYEDCDVIDYEADELEFIFFGNSSESSESSDNESNL